MAYRSLSAVLVAQLVCAIAALSFSTTEAHLRGLAKGNHSNVVLPTLVPGVPLTLSVFEDQYLDWFLPITKTPSTFECTVLGDGSFDLTLAPGSNHGDETHFCLEDVVNGTKMMTCRTDIYASPLPLLVRLHSFVNMDNVVLDCRHAVPTPLEAGVKTEAFDLDAGQFQSFVLDTTTITSEQNPYINCDISWSSGDAVMFIYEVFAYGNNQTSHTSSSISGLTDGEVDDVLVSPDALQVFIVIDAWETTENITVDCEDNRGPIALNVTN